MEPQDSRRGQYIYERSNGAKSILMAMCIGLKSSEEEPRSLGDLTLEPYISSKQKRQFTPKKDELYKELERRCALKGNEKPRAANWSNKALLEWLVSNPIDSTEEVNYLRIEEKKFVDMLVEAAKETSGISDNSVVTPPGVVWNNLADMRLIHCLTVDSVKERYLRRNEVLNRRELDAIGGPRTEPSVDEVIANKYNDPSFNPRSIVLPTLHQDFQVSHDLSLENVPCEVSPEPVKRWLADRKAKLVLIINKWERSGNGGGNRRDVEDEGFGQAEGISFQDDDDRANFLSGNRSSLLYFWHVAIEHELLSHTVNILPRGLGATTESISPVSRKSRKRKGNDENTFPEDIVEGFRGISRATRSEELANCEVRIERSEKKIEDYIKKMEGCEDGNLRQFYQERLDAAKKMLVKATDEYDKLQE